MQQWQSHKQKYKINKCAPLWSVDAYCRSTSLCLKGGTWWIEPTSCKSAKEGSATQIHIRGHSTTKRWHEMGWPWPSQHWERGPRAGPAGWHSAALEGRTPFVRQTPSRPLLLLLCTDLIYSALLCPILHSPPLPLLCRPCTTAATPAAFFYCRLCLVRTALSFRCSHTHSVVRGSVANPTLSWLEINCSIDTLMKTMSGMLKEDFHGFAQNATSNCYLLLGRALLHDFAAWCAWECSGQQQHDMLEEIEEEAPQVQHSQHIPQATVETHRSCRASSFCS